MNAFETKQVWPSICETHRTEAEWLECRKSGIGASEVAAIFGCGYANQSPITVWNSKVGGPQPEIPKDQLRRMARGKKLEPVIAGEFEIETGLKALDPGDYTVFRSADHPWLFATLDRFTVHPEYGPIPVELKAVHGRFYAEWDEEEEPPLKYMVQCQTQMAVTGTSHCYLVGLIGGDEVVVRLIERNQRFIDAMVVRLAEFWGFVQRKEMPPVDESEATRLILGLIYPRDMGHDVALPPEAAEWDRELNELEEQMKSLESRKDGIENKLRAAIGDATRGRLLSGSYTLKSQTRTVIDFALLRERFPEAAAICSRESSFRVLRRSNK